MGYLLGITNPEEFPKFSTKKWVGIFDHSNGIYNSNEDVIFKTPQLRNDLCDFNDAYIVITGKITATNPDSDDDDILYERKLAFKNSAPFFNCILKINSQLIEDAQDLDVMPMYNLLHYSKNFRKTTGSFWNCYPDVSSSEYAGNNERTRVFYPISNSRSFDYQTKIIGKLPDGENELEGANIVVRLKNLSNFTLNLDFLLINAEIEPSDLKFNIIDRKVHVPVVTLQTEYQNQLYEELKAGISIDFTWSKYGSQVINQTATFNCNYLIDPTFCNVSKLFFLAFENEEDTKRFSKYYTPTVEIKYYNVILDGQEPFYEIPIRNKEETYKAITEMIEDGNFRKGNEFSYEYFCTHYKLIAIDLSKQKSNLEDQQINFIGKLEQDATIFFIIEKKHLTGLEFLQNSLSIV